jgi:hypothetical protein
VVAWAARRRPSALDAHHTLMYFRTRPALPADQRDGQTRPSTQPANRRVNPVPRCRRSFESGMMRSRLFSFCLTDPAQARPAVLCSISSSARAAIVLFFPLLAARRTFPTPLTSPPRPPSPPSGAGPEAGARPPSHPSADAERWHHHSEPPTAQLPDSSHQLCGRLYPSCRWIVGTDPGSQG